MRKPQLPIPCFVAVAVFLAPPSVVASTRGSMAPSPRERDDAATPAPADPAEVRPTPPSPTVESPAAAPPDDATPDDAATDAGAAPPAEAEVPAATPPSEAALTAEPDAGLQPPAPVVTAPRLRPSDVSTNACLRDDGVDVCRRIDIGGGITTALGIAGVGIGLGIVGLRDQPAPGSSGDRLDFRSAGVMTISVAATFLIAGALVLNEARKLRRADGGRRAARATRPRSLDSSPREL